MHDALLSLCNAAMACNAKARFFLELFDSWEERPEPPFCDYWGPGNRAYNRIVDGLGVLRDIRDQRDFCYSSEMVIAWQYVERGTLSDPIQQYRVGESVFSMAHEAALMQGHNLSAMARSVGVVSATEGNPNAIKEAIKQAASTQSEPLNMLQLDHIVQVADCAHIDRVDLEENFEIVERAVAFFSEVKFDDLSAMIRREYLKAVAVWESEEPKEPNPATQREHWPAFKSITDAAAASPLSRNTISQLLGNRKGIDAEPDRAWKDSNGRILLHPNEVTAPEKSLNPHPDAL